MRAKLFIFITMIFPILFSCLSEKKVSTPGTTSKKIRIGIISNAVSPFWSAMAKGMEDAAQKLGISVGSLHNWNMKLRKRLVKERGHLNACLAQMQRAPLLQKVMSIKRPLEKLKDLEEEE